MLHNRSVKFQALSIKYYASNDGHNRHSLRLGSPAGAQAMDPQESQGRNGEVRRSEVAGDREPRRGKADQDRGSDLAHYLQYDDDFGLQS